MACRMSCWTFSALAKYASDMLGLEKYKHLHVRPKLQQRGPGGELEEEH